METGWDKTTRPENFAWGQRTREWVEEARMDKNEIERRRLATKALAPLTPEAFATPIGRGLKKGAVMGIRDEIEKLEGAYLMGEIYPGLLRRDDVLSILDEWELVGEIELTKENLHAMCFLAAANIDTGEILKFYPGDHIAIYKRIVHDPNTGRGKDVQPSL